jgi:hypothetical protein
LGVLTFFGMAVIDGDPAGQGKLSQGDWFHRARRLAASRPYPLR